VLLAGLAIAGWRGWGRLDRPLDARLRAITGTAVIVIIAVEGAFDAVLMLATPTLVFWASVGVLLPLLDERRAPASLGRGRRALLGLAVLVIGFAAAELSALKIVAMDAYNTGQLGRAAAFDPGSFKIRLRYAQLMMSRGSRKRGCEEAKAARALFPRSPDAIRLAAGCK